MTGTVSEPSGPGRLDVVVLAGGTARRLGGVSKPDVVVAGARLLDHVLGGLDAMRTEGLGLGRVCVVAPRSVRLPAGVLRALEDPPLGGPVAGVGAGLLALATTVGPGAPSPAGAGGPAPLTALLACDAPASWQALPVLVSALPQRMSAQPSQHPEQPDGAVLVTPDPRGGEQVQYLVGIYRTAALTACVLPGGRPLRDAGVRRTLRALDLVQVRAGADQHLREAAWDLDTWEDVAAWPPQWSPPPSCSRTCGTSGPMTATVSLTPPRDPGALTTRAASAPRPVTPT